MLTILKSNPGFKANPRAIFTRLYTQIGEKPNPLNAFTERTHTCGELTVKDVGKRVKLYGWLKKTSFDNKIVIIKDSYGSTQCVLNKSVSDNYQVLRKKTIHHDSILKVSGLVRDRPEGKVNLSHSNGAIEILADKLEIINPAIPSLPIQSKDHDLNHPLRLKYRYLDLRRKEMQEALRFKSKFCQILRMKLTDWGFIDCETPTLFNRTPGGANEFIVPSQDPGKYYNLVQSPQQLKQLLMIGAIDRYFQICKCYRDETARPDRQPEFTQVDIELSFTNQESVMQLVDQLLHHVLSKLLVSEAISSKDYLSSYNDKERLPRMSFKDAFRLYGTDKPDTRFECKIQDSDNSLMVEFPLKLDEKTFNECLNKCQDRTKQDLTLSLRLDSESSVIETCDKTDLSRQFLGTFRTLLASQLEANGNKIYTNRYSFTWITDFPLLKKSKLGTWEPSHHPFTAPSPQTISLIDTNVDEVIGQHYDLVLNGQEIAGGSIRIHDAELQSRLFEIINVDSSLFSYFLEALRSGCPPHGGIAIGLDRLIALLLQRHTIRETIAFPKSGLGRDLMTDTPHGLNKEVLELYHQKIN